MLRILKRYNFGFHETEGDNNVLVNGKIIEFTSYPGSIYSQDDFYKITKKNSKPQTTVVGTELKNNNRQLWEKIMKTDQVLLGARVMAANRLANNSKIWHEVFSKYNSGTGNKQWLIISMNNTSIEYGVIEQMPGIVSYDELSETLLSNSYWVGSSSPSLEETAYISNNGDRSNNPVANVLYDRQENVTDVESLAELMRGPELSLIGRSDLLGVKTAATFRRFSGRSFAEQLAAVGGRRSADSAAQPKDDRAAAVVVNKSPAASAAESRLDIDKTFTGTLDLKIVAGDASGFVVASGPPFTANSEEVKPFRWSDSPIRHLPHYGHPDVWDYSLTGINWVWNN